MAAYLIVDIAEIHDEATYASYREHVSKGLTEAGGSYLVRGGAIEILEGDWRPGRVVVVRFDSMAAARQWWASAAYERLKQLRQTSTTTHMILVEGLPEEAKA